MRWAQVGLRCVWEKQSGDNCAAKLFRLLTERPSEKTHNWVTSGSE